jgi:hypothetical protein
MYTEYPSKEIFISYSEYRGDLQSSFFNQVRFQVLMATSKKMAVFWTVASCSLVDID